MSRLYGWLARHLRWRRRRSIPNVLSMSPEQLDRFHRETGIGERVIRALDETR